MSTPGSHTTSASPVQGQPVDRFRKVGSDVTPRLLPCRFCGHPAELWQRWEHDDVWFSFGACTNLEDVDGEPCMFHLPDAVAFYLPRKVEAIRYWNLMMGPRDPITDENQVTGEQR